MRIAEPRDREATMASDWEWVLAVLRMVQDRALDGERLRITRPPSFSPKADMIATTKGSVIHMLDDIFANAVVVEPENAHGD